TVSSCNSVHDLHPAIHDSPYYFSLNRHARASYCSASETSAMKSMISGLFLSTLCLALAGCALTEVVTPPPPATHTLPPQAQAFLDQPVPQCMAPVTRTQAAINKQNKLLKAQQAQLEALRQAELARWERRQAYLEDELEFYKKEVRRTGGSWELTKTTDKPVPFKLSTTGNFT